MNNDYDTSKLFISTEEAGRTQPPVRIEPPEPQNYNYKTPYIDHILLFLLLVFITTVILHIFSCSKILEKL